MIRYKIMYLIIILIIRAKKISESYKIKEFE